MGSDRRFTWVLAGWVLALAASLVGLTLAIGTGRLGAVTLVTSAAVGGALTGLVRHVGRTNLMLARFVEALRHGDFATRFDTRGGSGFAPLGEALSGAMRDMQSERVRITEELRFWEAMIDDLPVALLTVDGRDGVGLANKAARQLFDRHKSSELTAFGVYGEALLAFLSRPGALSQEIAPLRLAGGTQRALLRAGVVARLGNPVRVVAVEPVQSALDAVEVGTQTDLVRVLTHEILNSLTPVTSLAGTTAVLLGEEEPDIAEARLATVTLAHRAESLRRFIDNYRSVARLPEPRRRRFAAQAFAAEIARLFRAEWVDHQLTVDVAPDLVLDADPDLLAQLLINLLRNAAQATEASAERGEVRLGMTSTADAAAVITVEDNGAGIPEAARSDIFLPFFTTRPTGAGIGLNLARQIAVAHGWQIDVRDSTLGGTAIRVLSARDTAELGLR